MAAKKKLPPIVEAMARQLGRQFFTGLRAVGERAIAAAAKSTTKDAQRFVSGVQEKLSTLEAGLTGIMSSPDEEIEAELVEDKPAPKKSKKGTR